MRLSSLADRTSFPCWLHRFDEVSLEAPKKSGRPQKADEVYQAELKETANTNTSDLGYPVTRCNLEILREHLKRKTGVKLDKSPISRLLEEAGFRYGQPRLNSKHRQDPQQVAVAKRLRTEGLKNARKSWRTPITVVKLSAPEIGTNQRESKDRRLFSIAALVLRAAGVLALTRSLATANRSQGCHMPNLFTGIPEERSDELTELLAAGRDVRIERIVSTGHASPEGFWYDQEMDEWVVVLRGEARLRFEDDPEPLDLKPGDYANIPAHRRHRVEWTLPDEPTVWLAVFHRK